MVEFEAVRVAGRVMGRLYFPTLWEQGADFNALREHICILAEKPYATTKAIWFHADKSILKYLLAQYPNRHAWRSTLTQAHIDQLYGL